MTLRRVPLQRGDKPLQRRTALTPGLPLQRQAALPRQASPLPRQGALKVSGDTGKAKAPRQRQGRDTGPSRAVKDLVLDRDRNRCVICGQGGDWLDPLVANHRVNRGIGGSTAPWINLPSNLVTVHASENLLLEDEACELFYANGWKVRRGTVLPADVPVLYPDGRRWLLRDDGGRDGFPHSAHDD